jgi:hypothetical protein
MLRTITFVLLNTFYLKKLIGISKIEDRLITIFDCFNNPINSYSPALIDGIKEFRRVNLLEVQSHKLFAMS